MSKPNKERIATNATDALKHNPFADLHLENFPEGQPQAPAPPISPSKPLKPGRVVLRRETARRGGKTVIVVDDFAPQITLDLIEDLMKRLRKTCGCGAVTRGRTIEVQGDQPDRIRLFLEKEGFRVAGV